MDIKIRLLQLGKKQVDLLREIHAMGFKEIDAAKLSSAINFKMQTPRGCESAKCAIAF